MANVTRKYFYIPFFLKMPPREIQVETVILVSRGCGGPGPGVPGCRTRQLGGGASASICSCSSDLCNMIAGANFNFDNHFHQIFLNSACIIWFINQMSFASLGQTCRHA